MRKKLTIKLQTSKWKHIKISLTFIHMLADLKSKQIIPFWTKTKYRKILNINLVYHK